MKKKSLTPVSISTIENKILVIRGEKVILDSDLAELYGAKTGRLNEAVNRNIDRFPKDFMFQLTKSEADSLRSQFAILESGRGKHRKYLPKAFTEHGALMAANILKSQRATQTSIQIVRTFILMRQALSLNNDLAKRINDLESKYDKNFKVVFEAIRALMNPPEPKRKPIGFRIK